MPAPKVTTSVEDLSTRINSTGTYNSAIVIAAKKGEINKPIKVTGQTDFLRKFTPNERIEIGWDMAYYDAYQYLAKHNGLYVVRAAHTQDLENDENDYPVLYGGSIVKTAESTNLNIPLATGVTNPEEYNFQEDDAFLLYGANPGAYNNDIAYKIETDIAKTKLAGTFILYIYRNKELVETHVCSLDPSLKNGYGVNCFIETVLQGSLFVRALSYAIEGESGYPLPKKQEELLSLKGGSDGSAVTDGDRIVALKTLKNVNDVNIQLIMDGGNTTDVYARAIQEVCDYRDDSVHGIISSRYEDEVNADALTAVKNYRNDVLNINSYSMELYTPHQKVYDEFNDRYIYISPSSFVAAQIMSYVEVLGWHWAIAGYNRGVINSIDVAVAYDPEIVDEFSDAQINTIIKDPGSGNVIFDELTLRSIASDLQDAHISRYINIYLRPKLKNSLKAFLFEFNDTETRSLITKMINTFMEPEKSARAVYAYRVICDESNNRDNDIQNNILNCWLYVKPTKIAKWIRQKIIITPYSTDLESIEIL